jgi:hypothetical protein
MFKKPDEYKNEKEEHLRKFLDYTQKTPQQIINENQTLDKKEFKKIYSNNFNSFIIHLKRKKIKLNVLRETTDEVQDFFIFSNLPLSLGIRGHLNLLLK